MFTALKTNRVLLMGGADRHVRQVWQMPASAFIEAIKIHFTNNLRVFCKTVPNPPRNCKLYQANIRLDPESGDDDDDVYVEFRLYDDERLITTNAHDHTTFRLPK